MTRNVEDILATNMVVVSQAYREWLVLIENQSDPLYYSHLVEHASDVVAHTKQQNQTLVAECLKLPQPKLSCLLQVLKEIDKCKA